MPISAENRKKYPPNWQAIRARILEREKNACKWCGAKNKTFVTRDKDGRPREVAGMEAEVAILDGEKVTRIVLTIAHLDHGLTDHTDSNLAALCQKCHLTYDAKQHAANAAVTRDKKRRQNRFEF